MRLQTEPTVALVDTRWEGHHPTYLREFSASLLRIGAHVLLLCRKSDEIISQLPQEQRCRVHSHPFVHRNHGMIAPHRDHDPASTLLRWRATGNELRAAEKNSGRRADLVFFCYLDSYIRFAPFPVVPSFLLGRPWSGLYFRNAHLGKPDGSVTHLIRRAAKGDRILANSDCKAVCVLDERFNLALERICGHPVLAFPDITDETPPTTPCRKTREIMEKSAGRKIVGMISMEKRKGLLTFLRCAIRAHERGEPWFFAVTGPFMRETFSAQELSFCDEIAVRASSGGMDNLYFDTSGERIPDGAAYNTLFGIFDVIWAAYEGFEGSSNALTKAAAFRKPLIATAGECIGKRVECYQLGETIPEADVDAALEAIRKIVTNEACPERRFAEYHRLHSRDHLDSMFVHLAGGGSPV